MEACPQRKDLGRTWGKSPQQKNNFNLKCCYKCGSTEHGLSQCPEMKKGKSGPNGCGGGSLILPFAICFVCNEKGHLASHCPKNDKGIFVDNDAIGCRTFGSKRHLSRDCPNRNGSAGSSEGKADNGHKGWVIDDSIDDDGGFRYDNEEELLFAASSSPPPTAERHNNKERREKHASRLPDDDDNVYHRKQRLNDETRAIVSSKKIRRVVKF